ncbi:hypothetical protein [Mesorhizobium sp. M0621]
MIKQTLDPQKHHEPRQDFAGVRAEPLITDMTLRLVTAYFWK